MAPALLTQIQVPLPRQTRVGHFARPMNGRPAAVTSSLGSLWKSFLKGALPGLRAKGHAMFRLLWVLGYVGGVVVLVALMKPLYMLYRGNYVNTVLSVVTENHRVFPTLTFCNANEVKKSRLVGYQKFEQLATLDLSEKFELYLDIIPDESCRIGGMDMFADLNVSACGGVYEQFCIPESWRCDGKVDCPEDLDELDCAAPVDPDNLYFEKSPDVECEARFEKCGPHCITSDDLCLDRSLFESCPLLYEQLCQDVTDGTVGKEYTGLVLVDRPVHWRAPEGSPTYENDRVYPKWFVALYPLPEPRSLRSVAERHSYFLRVQFWRFQLEEEKMGQCKDRLVIRNTDVAMPTPDWVACGRKQTPFSQNFTYENMLIMLETDVSEVDAGVELTVTVCNATWCQEDPGPVTGSPDPGTYPVVPTPGSSTAAATSTGEHDATGVEGESSVVGQQHEGDHQLEDNFYEDDELIFGEYDPESNSRNPPIFEAGNPIKDQAAEEEKRAQEEAELMANSSSGTEPQFQGVWRLAIEQSRTVDFRDVDILRRSFSEQVIKRDSSQLLDLVVDAVFKHRDLDVEKEFTQETTSLLGNCYLFNTMGVTLDEKLNWIDKVGSENGFQATLFVGEEESVNFFTDSVGVKMFVNTPGAPSPLDNDFIFLRPGHRTTVGVESFKVNRLGEGYSNCQRAWPDFIDSHTREQDYRAATCSLQCLNTRLKERCGCREQFLSQQRGVMEGEYRQCNPWLSADRICRSLAYEEYFRSNGTCSRLCLQACDEEGFQYTTTYEEWPNEGNVAYLVRRYLKSEPETSAFGRWLRTRVVPQLQQEPEPATFARIRDLFRQNVL